MKMFQTWNSYRYKQYACVLTVSILDACNAMIVMWLSPVIPQLTSDESPIGDKLSTTEESWLISAKSIGSITGCVLGALLTERIGRKNILLLSALPYFSSWIIAAFSKMAIVLIISQSIAGISEGMSCVAMPMYIGEIAEKDIRGRLGLIPGILHSLGKMFTLVIGPFVSYFVLTISCSVFPVIFAILFVFMPETPYYLVKIGNKAHATKNLKSLSSKTANADDINARLSEIEQSVAGDMEHTIKPWDVFINRNYRKAFLICLVVKSFSKLCGKNFMNNYLQQIISLSGSTISQEMSSIIFGIIQLPSAFFAAYFVDKTGRRSLLITSCIGCAVTLITEGVYFYLHDMTEVNLSKVLWLPTITLTLYLLFANFGIMLLADVLMGEVFTLNVKSIAIAYLTIYGSLVDVLIAKFFVPLVEAWGFYTVFWVFGGSCIVGTLYGVFGLPETKGKSFLEIQNMLNNNVNKA